MTNSILISLLYVSSKGGVVEKLREVEIIMTQVSDFETNSLLVWGKVYVKNKWQLNFLRTAISRPRKDGVALLSDKQKKASSSLMGKSAIEKCSTFLFEKNCKRLKTNSIRFSFQFSSLGKGKRQNSQWHRTNVMKSLIN